LSGATLAWSAEAADGAAVSVSGRLAPGRAAGGRLGAEAARDVGGERGDRRDDFGLARRGRRRLDQADCHRGNRFAAPGGMDRRAEAVHALGRFFVIDRVAALSHGLQLLFEFGQVGNTVAGQRLRPCRTKQLGDMACRQRGQHRLARRGEAGGKPAADAEIHTERAVAFTAGEVQHVGAIEHRQHDRLLAQRIESLRGFVEGCDDVRLALEGLRPVQRLRAERVLAAVVAHRQSEHGQRMQQPVQAAFG
jgi:hypothetical protein